MTVRQILRWPDRCLSRVCEPVGQIDAVIQTLAREMLETMYAAPGRGLAAPQVGVNARLFVMDVDWKDGPPAPMVFINPAIETKSDDMAVQFEGCLSIPGVSVEISRPAEVVLSWSDLDGKQHNQAFTGLAAACVQHELDHLNGIITFDHLSPQKRAQSEAEYAQAVL